jgi:2-C-methyl-D-erythritol 4-phosphate cytidylyltransferase/2-C-methyl-D-erythritol 2,4-cyclodiphosphate synthase
LSAPAADVVIVAAGSSTRMGGIDKLDASIGGRPLLAWTLEPFATHPSIARIALVASAEWVSRLRDAPWLPERVTLVAGGARRQESVAAGVGALEADGDGPDDRVVLVHDGARPLVSAELIERVVAATARHGAAIPVVPVVETLKRLDGDRIAGTVERDALAAAQTPQGVRLGILREAWRRYPAAGPDTFTDEAGLLEACPIQVHVVPGQPDNLKATVPADLDRAAAILAPDRARIGFGDDAHPFGPGAPLALGGIEHPGAPRLHGHSDGDVALHAVADALLGAAGLGDLGGLFPADARTPRGIASSDLVRDVVARLAAAGYRPASVDLTIIAARPRLGARLEDIRGRLAELVGLEPTAVNVKASTGNLAGPEGAGRGIAARAVATIERAR